MPRNPDVLTPILDAQRDFTLCPTHITRLGIKEEKENGQLQYYQEQEAFTGEPAFGERNASAGDIYQRQESKGGDEFVLVSKGSERDHILKVLRKPDSRYSLYAEIEGERIALPGNSTSLALYTHNETRELWIGKSDVLDGGTHIKNDVLKELIANDIFAYYGVSVPRLRVARVPARFKNATLALGGSIQSWHIFSRWLDRFTTYGYMPKFKATDPYFKLIINDREVREQGLGAILAVAHFVNDIDAMNSDGNNVGYQLKTNAEGQLYAHSCKIDPGWAFTNCHDDKSEAYKPTRAIRVSGATLVLYDDLSKATQAEFIQTLALINETPDTDIERFFKRGGGLQIEQGEFLNNHNAITMLKARRKVLSQLFAKELQAAKTANATQQPLAKPRVHLPPELAPIYTHMQYEQADPLVQQARYFYIPPNTTRTGDKTEVTEPLQVIMDAFLSDNTQRTLLLLGDSGFGKSTTTQIFYQLYWEQYLTKLPQSTSNNSFLGKAQENRISLRIELKQFSQRTVLRCVDNTLKDIYRLTEKQIRDLKNCPCLIILDGFDEIAGRLKCNLWQSNQLQAWRDVKLLITCRPVYLEAGDLPLYFYPSPQQAKTFVKWHLAPFTPAQIETYLQQASQDKPTNRNLEIKKSEPNAQHSALIVSQVANSRALQELLEVPLMLKIFTDALPVLEQQDNNLAELNRYGLYQAFMQHWFNRHKDRLSQHLGQAIDESICQRFLTYSEDLAFELFKINHLELDYAPGQAPWDRFFSQLDEESTQLRSGCPLRRIGNRYGFIHRSFFEFFVVQKILRQAIVSAETTENSNTQSLIDVLMTRFLTEEEQILNFLSQATKANQLPKAFIPFLFSIIRHSVDIPGIATASSNAATILNACEVQLSYQNWLGVQLPQVDLSYSVLAHSDLRGANLQGANLTRCILHQANLQGADLRNVRWSEYPPFQMKEKVNAIAHHPTQPWIAIAQGKTIILKNRDTDAIIGQPMMGHTNGVTSIAFSPDGETMASGGEHLFGLFGGDCTVRLWDTQTQKIIGQPMEGHTDGVYSVAFSPDGRTVVSGSSDKTVRLWDTRTQKSLGQPMEAGWSVSSVAFSPDGRIVVSGGYDKTVRLWDTQFQKSIGQPMEGHTAYVSSVAFSPNGAWVVSGSDDHSVRLWDTQTQKAIGQPMKHTSSVRNVAFSPDSTCIVSGSKDQTVRLWDAQTQKAIGQPIEGHTNAVLSVAFSPDGAYLVSGSKDKTIRLWDIKNQKANGQPLYISSVLSVACSPDGATVVSGHGSAFNVCNDNTVRLWDTKSQKAIGQSMERHRWNVNSVAFSPDNAYVVSGSSDKTVRLWDTKTHKAIGQPMMRHMNDPVNCVAFSPDGATIISGGGSVLPFSSDSAVRLWDTKTQTVIGQPMKGHALGINSVAFSPDGVCIVSGSIDKTVRLWDAKTQTAIGQPMRGHTDRVTSVAFSPDGTCVASGSLDQTVCLWDTQQQKAIGQPIRGHTGSVESVAFSSNSICVVSGSKDQTVRLWKRSTT